MAFPLDLQIEIALGVLVWLGAMQAAAELQELHFALAGPGEVVVGDVAFGLEVDLGFAVSARQQFVDFASSICALY